MKKLLHDLPSARRTMAFLVESKQPVQVLLLVVGLLISACAPLPLTVYAAEPTGEHTTTPDSYKGSISVTEQLKRKYPTVNYDDMVAVEEGETLDVKIASILGDGLNVEGDEFYGKLSKDYTVKGKLLLPKGTVIHGSIEAITPARRMGRNGHIAMKFDYLITPDGREIPIEGDGSTLKSKAGETATAVAKVAGFTLGGGVIGAVVALRAGGLALAAASNGYTLGIGAGVGAAGGLAMGLMHKGESALLQPNTELKIKLGENMKLPSMQVTNGSVDTVALAGLTVNILGYRLQNDAFGQRREITLSVDMSNQTPHSFSTFDMALMDEDGRIFYPSPFGDTGLMFGKLSSNARLKGNLSFNVEDANLQHYLVFYSQYPRAVVAKVAVDERATPALVMSKQQRKLERQNRGY
jgi:hypothetical protein